MEYCTGQLESCWLGITCNTTDTSSCLHDNGDPVFYKNFAPGHLSAAGPCVYFNAKTSLWYSGSCFDKRSYVCQIDQIPPSMFLISFPNRTDC